MEMTQAIRGNVLPFRSKAKQAAIAAKLASIPPPAIVEPPKRQARKAKAPKPTPRERFEARVDRSAGPDACHPFTGPVTQSNGYGNGVMVDGRRFEAHRAAWFFEHGSIPAGVCVLHSEICGTNKLCSNVRHLRLGSNAENSADAKAAGRHKPRKLSADAAKQIVVLRTERGLKPAALAVQFGVSNQSIINVLKGRTYWKATGIGPKAAKVETVRPRKGQQLELWGAAA
jgi:hypothetical protein